jgi:hypothetical protein
MDEVVVVGIRKIGKLPESLELDDADWLVDCGAFPLVTCTIF